MELNGVESNPGGVIRGARFISSQKKTQVMPFAVDTYLSPPALGFGPPSRLVLDVFVLLVRAAKCLAKIANCVVRFVSVDMIDAERGPFAVDDQPCQSMGFVSAFADTNDSVAVVVETSGRGANRTSLADPLSPEEFSGLWDVSQKFSCTFGSQNHRAVFYGTNP